MIKFEKNPNDNFWNVLVIGGERLENSELVQIHGGKWLGWVRSEIDSRKLFPLALQDIEKEIRSLEMDLDEGVDRWIRLRDAALTFASAADPESKLILTFRPDFDNWVNPFSALDYLQSFKESAVGSSIGTPELNADITEGFRITCVLNEKDVVFGEKISQLIADVKCLSAIAAEGVLKKIRKNSLVT